MKYLLIYKSLSDFRNLKSFLPTPMHADRWKVIGNHIDIICIFNSGCDRQIHQEKTRARSHFLTITNGVVFWGWSAIAILNDGSDRQKHQNRVRGRCSFRRGVAPSHVLDITHWGIFLREERSLL